MRPLIPIGTVAEKSMRLPRGGDELHDLAHLDREAHVEHAVGLVEHQEVHAREVERAAPQVVEHPAGRARDHVGAGADALDLALHRVAAVDRLRPSRRGPFRAPRSPAPPGSPARAWAPARPPARRPSSRPPSRRSGCRRPRSCPCPCATGRRGPCRRARGGSSPPARGSAPRSPSPRGSPGSRRRGKGRRSCASRLRYP